MIKVNSIVEQIVLESNFVEHALNNNFLNLSEYARHIKKTVEKRALKKVNTGTIIVSLSRLRNKKSKELDQFDFGISELSIKSPLVVFVYEKNEVNLNFLSKIYSKISIDANVFLTITQSTREIMITTSSQNKDIVMRVFSGVKEKMLIDNLVGISIHLKKDVLNRPGILYSILKGLAWNKISIVDVVSTFTEFVFIVRKEKAKEAFDFINDFYTAQY